MRDEVLVAELRALDPWDVRVQEEWMDSSARFPGDDVVFLTSGDRRVSGFAELDSDGDWHYTLSREVLWDDEGLMWDFQGTLGSYDAADLSRDIARLADWLGGAEWTCWF